VSNDLETIRRIRAWHEGRPTARGAVRNVHVAADDDLLVVAFLRMGGESRPWGVAIGMLAQGPRVFTVPDARNRDLVADMMIEVAPSLLRHFRHPQWSHESPGGFQTQSLRQLWLPGSTHLEMLQFLAAAYARTRWERPDVVTLRALGNVCNSLFMEAQRPGQQIVVTATEALRTSYVFPAAPIRQAHLGFLLGWLDEAGSRHARWSAAHDAEELSVSTVLGPETERRELEPLVSAWGRDRSAESATAIDRILSRELERRWHLTASSVQALRADPRSPNASLDKLVSKSAQSFFHTWGERVMNEAAGLEPYWPNVFTDLNARSASASFHARVADHEESRFWLVNGDCELQREELAAGHGMIASVLSVDEAGWIVEWSYPDITTIEPGKTLVVAGRTNMQLSVVEVDVDGRRMVLAPRWKKAKSSARHDWAARDPKWEGSRLVFLADSPVGIMRRKITAAHQGVESDITSFLLAPRARHAAYDDDGLVVETAEAAT
jgi:hypothetical protein